MYQTILVPLDGSPLSEIVLPYLKHVGAKFEAQIIFVHVCRERAMAYMCETYVKHVAEVAEMELKNTRGISAVVVESGNVAAKIIEEAERRSAGLIFMASHGDSGKGPGAFGSVTHRALTDSTIPVMVVKEGLREQVTEWPEQAIVPLDGSSLSETVLPHVLEFGKAGTRITLLRVCEPPLLLADYPDTTMPDNWEEHSRLAQRGAERTCSVYLEDFAKERLIKEGVRANAEVILADRAANGIIDYANKDSSALVMMSTHGQSGLSLFPYGHVADRVLLACRNPILLVRTQKSRESRRKAEDSSSG